MPLLIFHKRIAFHIPFAIAFAIVLASRPFPANAQAPVAAPLPLVQTFAKDADGWMALGAGASVTLAPREQRREAEHGALKMNYSVGNGPFGLFVLPIAPGALTHAHAFRFAIHTDYATTIAFALQEKDGGRYIALIAAPRAQWQTVELTPADFVLASDPNDPKDPDNKLDLDQIEYAGLVDVAQISAQSGNAAMQSMFGVQLGPHTLYLTDFRVDEKPLDGNGAYTPPGVIDNFAHPQVGWIVIGASARVQNGSPLTGRGLAVAYTEAGGKLTALLHQTPEGEFAGKEGIHFTVASVLAVKLTIQVEQSNGDKFNTEVDVPQGTTAVLPVHASFASFQPAEDSKDPNGKMDLTQVTKFLIVDAAGLTGKVTTPVDNTLYIGDLRLLP